MKIALITDTHFGARNENSALIRHTTNFFKDTFWPYIDEYDIKTIIHLGDLVDKRKSINFLTLNNLRKSFIQPAFNRSISTHIIVGNHDMYYKNTNQVNSVNELYGETPFIFVHDRVDTVLFDGMKICLVPWMCPENEDETFTHLTKTDAQVVMGHLELNGFTMHRGIVCEHGYDREDFRKFDQVFSGHFHHKNGNGHIEYLGSPYQLMWSDYDAPRGFHIYETDTREIEFIENPIHIFKRLNYSNDKDNSFDNLEDKFIKVIVEKKENPYHLEQFIDSVYKDNPYSVTIVDESLDFSDTNELVDEAEDTLTILGKYVDELETDLDKVRLKILLQELYSESMEII